MSTSVLDLKWQEELIEMWQILDLELKFEALSPLTTGYM